MLRKGEGKARVINRARILLWLDDGKRIDFIARNAFISTKTIGRMQGRYVDGGLDRALYDLPRPGQPKKTTAKDDAYIVALACSAAPKGRRYWTLDLLKKALTHKKKHTLSRSAIHVRLSERKIKPWREKNVVHSEGHS